MHACLKLLPSPVNQPRANFWPRLSQPAMLLSICLPAVHLHPNITEAALKAVTAIAGPAPLLPRCCASPPRPTVCAYCHAPPPQLSLDMPAAHMQQPGQSTAVMIAAAGLQEHSTRGHVTPRQCRRVQRDPAAPTYPQMSAVGGPHLQICLVLHSPI